MSDVWIGPDGKPMCSARAITGGGFPVVCGLPVGHDKERPDGTREPHRFWVEWASS